MLSWPTFREYRRTAAPPAPSAPTSSPPTNGIPVSPGELTGTTAGPGVGGAVGGGWAVATPLEGGAMLGLTAGMPTFTRRELFLVSGSPEMLPGSATTMKSWDDPGSTPAGIGMTTLTVCWPRGGTASRSATCRSHALFPAALTASFVALDGASPPLTTVTVNVMPSVPTTWSTPPIASEGVG